MDTLVKSCGSTGAGAAMDLPVGVTRLVHYLGSGSGSSSRSRTVTVAMAAAASSTASSSASEAVNESAKDESDGVDAAVSGSLSAPGAMDSAAAADDVVDIDDDDASWEQPYQTTRALATGVAERASTRKNVGRVRLG